MDLQMLCDSSTEGIPPKESSIIRVGILRFNFFWLDKKTNFQRAYSTKVCNQLETTGLLLERALQLRFGKPLFG